MTRIRTKKTYGLALQSNSLMVPDGATEKLINVLHQRDGLYIKERGFEELYDASQTIYGCFEFEDYIIIIRNDTVTRIDKFGSGAVTNSISTANFRIDGTLRPATYAFFAAPFSKVVNEQAFFCTPNGIRVIRRPDFSALAGEVEKPGVQQPLIISNTDLLNANNLAFFNGESIVNFSNATGSIAQSKIFYTNDFIIRPARLNALTPQSYDCDADSAISFKAVYRKVLPNGQEIESPPSSPVFSYNPVLPGVRWATDIGGGLNPNQIEIFLNVPTSGIVNFVVNGEYSGVIVGAKSDVYFAATPTVIKETVDSPEVDGRYLFTLKSKTTALIGAVSYDFLTFLVNLPGPINSTELDDGTSAESKGSLSISFDRFSTIELNWPALSKVGDYIDIYYSKTEVPLSSNPIAIPDGDYYLAKEIKYASPPPVTVSFSDGIFQKGIPLYTNPSDGDRSRLPNIPPPGANCIEQWKGCMFYGNTYQRHQIELTHIGGSLTANRDFNIEYVGAGSPSVTRTFSFIQSTADAATIKKRIIDLCDKLSQNTNFFAIPSDSSTEFPGGMTIIALELNRPFKVFVSNSDLGNAFEPVIGTSFAASEVVSTAEEKRNRLYWSKPNQPEAVPFFIDIGSEDEDILNIKRTRDSLIVIKRDGIFSVYGEPGSGRLSVREIDTTVKGISATGVTSLGNRVFAKTNIGIVAISDTSMKLISRNQVEPLIKVSEENTTQDTVMYAAEDDKQLYIATATSPVDSTKTVYSYNTITESWSELSKVFAWGFVIDNNFTLTKTFQNNRVIAFGNKIFIERKDSLLTDFTDADFAFTVSAISGDGLTVTLSGAFSGPVGSALTWYNGTVTKIYRITAVSGADVTLNIPFSGSVSDAVTLYTPIESIIRTAPIDGGDSSYVKQFTNFIVNTRYDSLSAANISFRSDWFEYGIDVDWTKRDERRGWGQEQWGRFPWGQAAAQNLEYLTKPSQIIQTEVPRTQQKTTFLQAELVHNVACEGMFIQQMAFEVDTKSKRPAR